MFSNKYVIAFYIYCAPLIVPFLLFMSPKNALANRLQIISGIVLVLVALNELSRLELDLTAPPIP